MDDPEHPSLNNNSAYKWTSPNLALEMIADAPVGGDHFLEASRLSAATIPESGWYALCFVNEKAGSCVSNYDRAEDDGSDGERNQRREAKAGFSTFSAEYLANCDVSLWVQTIVEGNGDNAQRVLTKSFLSLLVDEKTKEVAKDVGRLYFLPGHSKVAVFVSGREKGTQQSEASSELTVDKCLKWFLAYRRSTSLDVGDFDAAKPGDAPGCKKAIMCAFCQKRFSTGRAVMDHWKQRHNEPNDNEDKESRGKYYHCSPENLPKAVSVVYQDNCMAVIDKPQGLAVMGAKTTLFRSDLLLPLAANPDQENPNIKDKANREHAPSYFRKPKPVHRLDAGTGGLLVIAKSKEAERHLKMCFANRECRKRYRALLLGRLEPMQGTIDQPVSDQPAKTRYVVLSHHPCSYSKDGWITSVDLFPETGRKHQLRKHMKYLGHSILGDRRYWGFVDLEGAEDRTLDSGSHKGLRVPDDSSSVMSRLCLWAAEITLPHPATEQDITVVLEDPAWFHHVIRQSAPPQLRSSDDE